jgi:antitoxin (DNA-binding transcriptional repressor) of toxin-antitoxin stability system
MRTVEMAHATASLSEYAEKARREGAVVVTLRGKPIATLSAVPKGADWESLLVGAHPKFLAILERSRKAHREQGGISPDEMRRHFGIKPKPKRKTKVTSTNPKFMAIIERSRASARTRGTLSLEELRRKYGLPAKSPRRRRRASR